MSALTGLLPCRKDCIVEWNEFDQSSLIFTYVLDLDVFDQRDFFEKAKLYLNISLYFLGQKKLKAHK